MPLTGVALSHEVGHAAYVPIEHRYLGAPAQLSAEAVVKALAPVLGDAKVAKMGHDVKYTEVLLRRHGAPAFEVGGPFRRAGRAGRQIRVDY